MHVLASQIKNKFLRCKYFLVCNVLWSNFQDILKILTFFKETEFLKKYVSFNAVKMWDQLYLYLEKKKLGGNECSSSERYVFFQL